MSVVENIAKYSDDVEAEINNVHEKMAMCETGKRMMEASQVMAMSEEMMGLMEKIGEPEIPEQERIALAKCMGEMLKDNPINGLASYAKYLELLAQEPEHANRKGYYLTVADSAMAVNNTKVYKDYIEVYNEFEKDNSPQAQAARQATQAMQMKMKQWSEG